MTTTTQSTTTRKTTTIDRENDENDSNEEEREEEIIDLDDFTNETEDDDERIGATDYSTVVYSDEESESMPVNIFTRLNNQNQNDEYYIERKTPQNNNKRFINENNKKNGSFSVPQIFHKKIRLDESSSQRISPYTVNSKVLNNHQNSFNNIPVVGRFTLPDNDLNSSRFNNIDLLSNYSISKNKLNLSTLKKQYQLEQKINSNLLNTEKPKSKLTECEEAIGNLISKWSKDDEDMKETENKEEDENKDIYSFSTNIKAIREEIQKKIEKNRKLHEEINNKSLKINLSQESFPTFDNRVKEPVAISKFFQTIINYLYIYIFIYLFIINISINNNIIIIILKRIYIYQLINVNL